MNNVKITNDAIEYLVDMCGLDKEEAEEHLITAISMCRISSSADGAGELVEAIEILREALERIKAKSEMWQQAARSTASAKAVPPWWNLGDIAAAALKKAARQEKPAGETLTASEALYGFMAWLTTRDQSVTFGAQHEAGLAVELITEFCKTNNLEAPRENWTDYLTHPAGESSNPPDVGNRE